MDETPEEIVERELAKGEKLLWAGQPRQGIVLRGSDAFFIPFSIFWGGFAIFWEVMAINSGAPWFFKLWGVPFVLVGLYLMVGRFFGDAIQRSRTVYGVGSQHAIIVSGLFSRRVKSLDLAKQPEISLTERRDGSGTISFGTIAAFFSNFPIRNWPGYNNQLAPSFDMINDAREVYDLIREAQRGAQ
jgi:hypothetical protein